MGALAGGKGPMGDAAGGPRPSEEVVTAACRSSASSASAPAFIWAVSAPMASLGIAPRPAPRPKAPMASGVLDG